jgi:Flp pilus assembly protein TadD
VAAREVKVRHAARAQFIAGRAALAAALALLCVAAVADDHDPSPPRGPHPPAKPPLPPEAPNPLDFADREERKKKTGGSAVAKPMDENAGRTAATRGAYLAALMAETSKEGCGAWRTAVDRACLDAAYAAVPASAGAELRRTLADARKSLAAGRWQDAQTQAVQASALDWKLLAPRLVAAQAIAAQGRQEDALKGPLDTAVSFAPEDAVALHSRALALWRLERLDDARMDLVQARKARPADGALALTLGAVELERGDAKAARPLLLDATDALPENPFGLRSLARALYLCQDWTGAAAVLERVVRVVEGAPLPPGQVAVAGRGPAPEEHLALAILCADRLDRRADAKAHARTFRQQGGVDLSLDAWLTELLAR